VEVQRTYPFAEIGDAFGGGTRGKIVLAIG
jgi:hypothetical protein